MHTGFVHVILILASLVVPSLSAAVAGAPSDVQIDKRASSATGKVHKLVSDWAVGKLKDISFASLSKGGWEGWLQVELVNFNRREHWQLGNVELNREVTVYQGSTERADLVISNPGGGPADKDIIELKTEIRVEGGRPNASLDSFYTTFNADIDKLTRNQLRPEFAGSAKRAIGITVTKHGQDYLERKWAGSPDAPTAKRATFDNDVDIVIWEWSR